jgi:hypothetical protein
MALNVDLEAAFGNMWDWEGVRQKAGEVTNTRKLMQHITRFQAEFPIDVKLVPYNSHPEFMLMYSLC